jgi:hypothetical protein
LGGELQDSVVLLLGESFGAHCVREWVGPRTGMEDTLRADANSYIR